MAPAQPHDILTKKAPFAAIAAAGLAALACSLLNRVADTEPAPTETSRPAPTATRPPLTAAEVLQSVEPASLAGVELESVSITGSDLDLTDPALADFLANLRVDPSELKISVVFAPAGSSMTFYAGAITIPGRDWAATLDGIVASAEADPATTWEVVTLDGRSVLRAAAASDERLAPMYYTAAGESLYFVQSSNSQTAEEAVSDLPGEAGSGGSTAPELPPPGVSALVILLIQQPQLPVCAGEPPGRHRLMAMALDTGLGILSVHNTFSLTGLLMASTSLPPFLYGPLLDYPYAAARYGGGGGERLLIEARAVLGGYGSYTLAFPVQHCLSGTWQDEERVLRIVPPLSDSFTAEVQSGTLCGEEGGLAFSGTLSGDQVEGSDLKACNPDECVDAGFLPNSVIQDFSGRVADDGMSITFDWTGPFYEWEEDDQGNLLYCRETSTEQHSFTITRLGWDGLP